MNILSLVRENIKKLKPYSTARDEFMGQADVFLDANENPFPSNYNRYPDPLQRVLKEKIATVKGVKVEQLFLGNGSDEAIDLLIRAFCEPAMDSILITEPTYGMYRVCAEVNNVKVVSTRLTIDFDLNIDSLKKVLDKTVKLIFLCSPNNPTGNLLSKDKIITLIKSFEGLVVVDEAYLDFAPQDSFTALLSSHPNLIILQTLSKAWGLAGLRLGMAFAAPEIIGILNKIKYPYNLGTATQQIVLDKISQPEGKDEQVKLILQERNKLSVRLNGLSFIKKVYPSDANFILVRINQAKAVYTYLINQNIIVRDRTTGVLCEDCLRITVGTPNENNRLISKLKEYEKAIVY